MSLDNADTQTELEEVEELIIQFDRDEESHSSDTDEHHDEETNQESSVIKDLRRELRQKAQELAKLKPNQQEQEIVLGDKPTLEGCDYDTDKFETEFDAYTERKLKLAQQEEAKKTKLTKVQEEQVKILTAYEEQAKALRVKDFDAKQQTFLDEFKDSQQGKVIFKAAKNKALVVYAIGSDSKLLDKLAAITDDIELAAEIARLEGKMKVSNRQPNIKPENTVRGGAVASTASASIKSQLAKLEAEAMKTGNRTAVVQFKKANKLL